MVPVLVTKADSGRVGHCLCKSVLLHVVEEPGLVMLVGRVIALRLRPNVVLWLRQGHLLDLLLARAGRRRSIQLR